MPLLLPSASGERTGGPLLHGRRQVGDGEDREGGATAPPPPEMEKIEMVGKAAAEATRPVELFREPLPGPRGKHHHLHQG